MLSNCDRIFSNLYGEHGCDIESSKERGVWVNTDLILQQGPQWIIDNIKKSGLRGRGGAAFPTGVKWSFITQNPTKDRPNYLVVNGDESEPGTSKDGDILLYESQRIIEGILVSSFALRSNAAFMYIRGEYHEQIKAFEIALQECYERGFIGVENIFKWPLTIALCVGAGAYICGEETALLESLEGKKGFPRLKPPFPAQCGLYGCPTIINNIETIASVPEILRRGYDWFINIGCEDSPGTKIFSLSGDVNYPCNVEERMGIALKDLIEHYGRGVKGGWDNLLAVIPGGSSVPLIPHFCCENVQMSYKGLQEVGTSLGTGGIIIINKDRDIIEVIERIAYFYKHESCGQCSPCREGTGWMWRTLRNIRKGNGDVRDIERLWNLSKSVEGKTICALADAAAWPIQGLIRHFRGEMELRLCKNNERKTV